ncbi:nitric-oxide reductase large subunit [Desulfofustis limnaeus]|jgi:nitric oxide reductase subunit B|uniref:Nitric-oxide reductase large subunit n=1 Tax=Desulfofustis limnaeus TaxID=2740163 RepID=A0ABM7WB73_9BACT|nr:nitric-oxide reductase large subunit [Desulfofustis limnaeus]MDX9895104.1 nitric-oxide reductase large subunit [Desulfofustis sp.]BDD88114.1 nitric-oxide reductase large subunit [Desulfofustis limnaeus]
MTSPRLKAFFLFCLVLTFGVLIFGGYLINREKPPIPDQVVTPTGETLFTGGDIIAGQNYYFSRGGQHIGTIWGHGSYLAPDWSADYLHRMGVYLAARHHGLDAEAAHVFSQADYDQLDDQEKARLQSLVSREIKTNRLDPASSVLHFTEYQTEAFALLTRYYTDLFTVGNERMGLQPGIVKTAEQGRLVTAFFTWLAWSAGTQRLDAEHTYTTNWPYDPLVGNEPLPGFLIWSIVSVILLIFGIAAALFVYQRYVGHDDYDTGLKLDFAEPDPTPSQKATLIFFVTAIALFVIQIGMGAMTAHYTVEGDAFFGIPINTILPYAAVRTWHIQLSIFFIATCFLAAGLFIGPFVGREPKGQATWVVTLFAALVVVVLGTLSGTWSSIAGFFEGDGFFFGHQGYEYIELGRFWQLLLIVGMIIWLVLVWRSIRPALKNEDDNGGLTHMLLYASISIPLFYMAGLLYGKSSHLSDAEYWRWWVVHLWVEGFFEVFATVVMAFLLSHIGAVSRKFALTAVYFTIFLYLGSGVIGTFHHLYWAGTPTAIIALGAVFSALEVVPLSLLGFEAAHNLRVIEAGGKNFAYRWPIYFFVSVAFWNLVGAGVFGFLINPPIVLYYAQGINTTPIHSHTALFGVYGMLAISLLLFSVRHIVTRASWSDQLLKVSFWGLNGGLAAMAVFSLIPVGFYQFYFAVRDGLWYARSPEITSGEVIRNLSWLRMGPDILFSVGAIALLFFLLRAIKLSFFSRTS